MIFNISHPNSELSKYTDLTLYETLSGIGILNRIHSDITTHRKQALMPIKYDAYYLKLP